MKQDRTESADTGACPNGQITPAASSTPRWVDHGITINEAAIPAGPMFEALCLCGYASSLVADRRRAVAAGHWHMEDVTLEASDALTLAVSTIVDTKSATPLPIWLTGACPQWCTTAHSDGDHPEDRDHRGDLEELRLHLPRAVRRGAHWQLAELRTALRQSPMGGAAWLHLWSDEVEPRISFDLTLDEGELLAALIMGGVARTGGGS